MKRLSRLTALLLAIMVLCAAIAYAEGVSVEDWTWGDYQQMEENAKARTAELECGMKSLFDTAAEARSKIDEQTALIKEKQAHAQTLQKTLAQTEKQKTVSSATIFLSASGDY